MDLHISYFLNLFNLFFVSYFIFFISVLQKVCGGIFFGIISAMMAIVNTASNPIEAICHIPGAFSYKQGYNQCKCKYNANGKTWSKHPIQSTFPGLYLWNGIALCSSTASVITWMVQFYLRLTHNVLIRESRWSNSFTTHGYPTKKHSQRLARNNIDLCFAILALSS